MTHISEERNIRADVKQIWPVIADSRRWPEFLRTPDGKVRLVSVEPVKGEEGTLGAVRRLTVIPHGTIDEQLTRVEPYESIEWRGVRTPGFVYLQQQLEIVPGRGFTTLRWDIYYELAGFKFFRKGPTRKALESAVLHALQEIETLALK